MSVSIVATPPLSLMVADLSRTDLGTLSPDRSSMAAGRFREASTLMTKENGTILSHMVTALEMKSSNAKR